MFSSSRFYSGSAVKAGIVRNTVNLMIWKAIFGFIVPGIVIYEECKNESVLFWYLS